jgi:hypothetical protein
MKTATAPQQDSSAAQTDTFLKYAPRKYYSIQGTFGASSGGAQVTWNQPVPIIPAYCTALHLNVQCTIAVTVPNNAGYYLSEFAPYSILNNQFTLGGAPPWPPLELTPWYFNESQQRIDFDPAYPGLGGVNSGWPSSNFFSNIMDQGLTGWINTFGNTTPIPTGGAAVTANYNVEPGVTITNTSGGQVVHTFACTFNITIRFQQKRHLLWGAIPFGDPENRPNHIMQLCNGLVGTTPESCFVVATAGAPTATTVGTTTVTATYELAYIDLVPDGVQIPEPTVGFGLQWVVSSISGLAVGAVQPITHRTAMAYLAIHHILVNSSKPLQADYFGLWDDQDQQSSRWNYDKSNFTFHQYFTNFFQKQRTFPLIGVYTADFANGVFPEIPSVDPLDSIMSPDKDYADAFGVPVTPAMTTALRIPSGTVASSPYVRVYAKGLVRVPY